MSPKKNDPLYRVELSRVMSGSPLRVWSRNVELLARIVTALNGKKPCIGIEPRLAKAKTA